METAPLEHIEAKIINFLRDANVPNPASQIAVHIQETRQDTLLAIQRLVKHQIIKGIQDLSFFNATGETVAYTLTDTGPMPPTLPPPVPPSRLRA